MTIASGQDAAIWQAAFTLNGSRGLQVLQIVHSRNLVSYMQMESPDTLKEVEYFDTFEDPCLVAACHTLNPVWRARL